MKIFYLFISLGFLMISSCSLDDQPTTGKPEPIKVTIVDSTWNKLSLDLLKVTIYDTYDEYIKKENGKLLEEKEVSGFVFTSKNSDFWLRVEAYNVSSKMYYENKLAHYAIYNEASVRELKVAPTLIGKPIAVKIKSITISGPCRKDIYPPSWDDSYTDDHLSGSEPDVFLTINNKEYFIFPKGLDYKGEEVSFLTPLDLREDLVIRFYDYDFNVSESDLLAAMTFKLSSFVYSGQNKILQGGCERGTLKVTVNYEL